MKRRINHSVCCECKHFYRKKGEFYPYCKKLKETITSHCGLYIREECFELAGRYRNDRKSA